MKIKIVLAAVGGLIVGIVAMWFLVTRTSATTGQVVANQYILGVMDQVNVAFHIRAHRQLEVLTNIEAALPSFVLTVDQEFRGYPGSTNALWWAKAYYQRSQIEIPSEIKGILDSLPPKPPKSCQIRLQALDNATTNTTDKEGTK
jgi:hypothetical protein